MSDQAVIALISFICISIFGAGYFCGNFFTNNKIDLQKIKLQNKIDSLEKSLAMSLLKTTVLDSKIKNTPTINAKK